MTWTNAITELRSILSDNVTDKEAWRKRVIGLVNGTNVNFKAFDKRLVTNLSTATAPYGAFVDGAFSAVTACDVSIGSFTLASAPADGAIVEATYFYQWFIDEDLTVFLNKSSEWLGFGEVFDLVPVGLKPSALNYAASLAYQNLGIKWVIDNSDVYKMQDNNDGKGVQNPWLQIASKFAKAATDSRNVFYQRQGQPLAPLFVSIRGHVKSVVPKS